MQSILFVCLGNICRSPTAEGVMRQKLQQRDLANRIQVDSAGTGSWHIGNPPDDRAQSAAIARGFNIGDLRARQVSVDDFSNFDLVIAMDHSNYSDLLGIADNQGQHKVRRMLEFADTNLQEVPDPYYGGDNGFDQVIDLLDTACDGLIEEILDPAK